MEIFILLALIFLNGLFVMSEIALVSARKSRLENLANKGDDKSRKALELANNPEIFLSAAQIGITLIAILTGVYSGERFGKYLQPSIEKIELVRPYAQTISTTIIVIIVDRPIGNVPVYSDSTGWSSIRDQREGSVA